MQAHIENLKRLLADAKANKSGAFDEFYNSFMASGVLGFADELR